MQLRDTRLAVCVTWEKEAPTAWQTKTKGQTFAYCCVIPFFIHGAKYAANVSYILLPR